MTIFIIEIYEYLVGSANFLSPLKKYCIVRPHLFLPNKIPFYSNFFFSAENGYSKIESKKSFSNDWFICLLCYAIFIKPDHFFFSLPKQNIIPKHSRPMHNLMLLLLFFNRTLIWFCIQCIFNNFVWMNIKRENLSAIQLQAILIDSLGNYKRINNNVNIVTRSLFWRNIYLFHDIKQYYSGITHAKRKRRQWDDRVLEMSLSDAIDISMYTYIFQCHNFYKYLFYLSTY